MSTAQSEGLRHLREVISCAGSPPCSAAEAYRELCGGVPGYATEPVLRAAHHRDKVSLPPPGPRCQPDQ
eukprot:1051443-Pyramimonas_sp.AAC.1